MHTEFTYDPIHDDDEIYHSFEWHGEDMECDPFHASVCSDEITLSFDSPQTSVTITPEFALALYHKALESRQPG